MQVQILVAYPCTMCQPCSVENRPMSTLEGCWNVYLGKHRKVKKKGIADLGQGVGHSRWSLDHTFMQKKIRVKSSEGAPPLSPRTTMPASFDDKPQDNSCLFATHLAQFIDELERERGVVTLNRMKKYVCGWESFFVLPTVRPSYLEVVGWCLCLCHASSRPSLSIYRSFLFFSCLLFFWFLFMPKILVYKVRWSVMGGNDLSVRKHKQHRTCMLCKKKNRAGDPYHSPSTSPSMHSCTNRHNWKKARQGKYTQAQYLTHLRLTCLLVRTRCCSVFPPEG